MINIIGQSPKLQEVLRTADLVAGTNVPVLITGDTGAGKDLFAQRIHQQSSRKQRAFIKLNCASASIEMQLFDAKKGALSQARSGTLFLDEISDLPAALQSKLLQFMEDEKFDVRIIVATHKNLYKEVKADNFRSDLFYRLNVIPVELPPLKEREGDVALLMDYFLRCFVAEQHQAMPSFSKAALKKLMEYNWPGNIRQLHNFCERMFILFSAKEVQVTNLPHEFQSFRSSETNLGTAFSLPSTGINLEQIEVDFIQQALQNSNGNKSHAARLLGLTRDTFLYRLKKYSL